MKLSRLNLAVVFCVALGAVSAVFASPFTTVYETADDGSSITERVPPIVIGNLSNHHGRYLKAFYVVGRSQFLDQQTQIRVLELKRVDLAQISGSEITLPSAKVVKKSIFAAYNYVILVISNNPDYTLLNPDGSLVEGQGDKKVIDESVVKVAISKDELLQPSIAAGIYTPGEALPENLIPYRINF